MTPQIPPNDSLQRALERCPFADPGPGDTPVPLVCLAEGEVSAWEATAPAAWRQWSREHAFLGERHRVLALPAPSGGIGGALLGLGRRIAGEAIPPWAFAGLPERLPGGWYGLSGQWSVADREAFALGVCLGSYRYDRYRRSGGPQREVRFAWPEGIDRARIQRLAGADTLARDLVNTPAEDLSPRALAAVAAAVGARHGAVFRQWVGQELLAERCHAIHAVGRAAAEVPRLVELRWGEAGPAVTLVGKGVCFDTGGLDLKPSAGMALMKKDMGGAAMALAVAELVMDSGLPVRLRVLLPLVENAVGANAFRPGDVLATRKGLTIEVTNTDAEGRLVLADALALAAEERPDLMVDLATLTGAARVALGPEVPAFFCNDRQLAADLAAAARAAHDPLWELPLWPGYEEDLVSRVADLQNAPAGGFAGAIHGALFLQRFVPEGLRWLHVDLYAWNPRDRPGRPVGAEAQGVRALFRFLECRYGGTARATMTPG